MKEQFQKLDLIALERLPGHRFSDSRWKPTRTLEKCTYTEQKEKRTYQRLQHYHGNESFLTYRHSL